ncbi:S24 family peptidase [Sphingomonas sp. RIT328]|uniref:S24 family peptidase n=1 Tax=Sphingomonas sp. RIT328 TaxID=1470591 RepID=UPI00044892B1|nr:S24 family peptidase [Sphingomonas sp. RIT328]EZP50045.1 putative phage repressor [Sphingomonas sp. RIT328]
MSITTRQALEQLALTRRVSLASLSKMLGRNTAYVQQYITRGTPAVLAEDDRRRLADFFGVDASVLGSSSNAHSTSEVVPVQRIQVEASAGYGSVADADISGASYSFDRKWIQSVCSSNIDFLSIIRVRGDSMTPTLVDGDDILVDRSPAACKVRDGIFVFRWDDTLMVKRLAPAPTSRTCTISSDNPAYPTWPNCAVDDIDLVGRVVWVGRRLR